MSMTSRRGFCWALIAALALLSVASAAPAGRGGGTSLRGVMNDMQKILLAIKAEAGDKGKREQALKDVVQLECDAAISKALSPSWVNTLPADIKPKEADKYRKMMALLLQELLRLEEAIDAGNGEDMKKSFAAIDGLMNDGHRAFAP